MTQPTTVELDESDPIAHAQRGPYEPPLIVDLGDSAELTQGSASGFQDGVGYS